MEAFESKSQLDNQQQHPAVRLQTDLSINHDELVEVFAQELEQLVVSYKDEVCDRDLQGDLIFKNEEDQAEQAILEEIRHLVVKEASNEVFQAQSSSENEEMDCRDVQQFVDEAIELNVPKEVLEEDRKECRVSEEQKAGESGIGCENQEEKVDDDDNENVFEHYEEDLKEKHEIEIIDGDVSSEIGGFENTNEERRSEDGNDSEYENVEDLKYTSETAGGEGGSSVTVPDDGRLKSYHYPLRPDAEDCSYYMRTGMCKYGSNCKFNHPLRKRNQQPTREIKKQKEENVERPVQIECKFFLSSGGCKYGKACKFNHGRGKTVITPVAEYNFLGLPIRPGEKECPYYMRNGSCKYGPSCRFNHPDPSAVGGEAPVTYGKDGHVPLQNISQQNMPNMPNMPSWSAPRTPEPTAAFVPMMYSPTQTMPSPNSDWNGYQAPVAAVYPSSERGLPIPPAFFLNNPPSDTNLYTHHHQQQQQQQQMVVSDYPERPGQPDCSYFMKTGDCKYRSTCKFHHPKSRITRTTTTPSLLSDKGLPFRPDQNICTHYSRYGICKYGPACKYDHPVNYSNSVPTGGGYRSDGSLIQQSV